MTDAHEIIAAELDRHCISPSSRAAGVIAALRAAGFRILGPDEVDPVTVEKCAEVAAGFADQTDYDLEPEAAVAESVTANGIASAIRVLGGARTP